MPIKSFAKPKPKPEPEPIAAEPEALVDDAPATIRKVTIRLSQSQWEQLGDVVLHSRKTPSLQALFLTAVREHLATKAIKLVD